MRSNQSILKEINPEYALKRLMLKLQYFGHICKELNHWKKSWYWERLRAGGEGATENEIVGWHHWFNGHELGQTLRGDEGQGGLVCCSLWSQRGRHNWATEQQQVLSIIICRWAFPERTVFSNWLQRWSSSMNHMGIWTFLRWPDWLRGFKCVILSMAFQKS